VDGVQKLDTGKIGRTLSVVTNRPVSARLGGATSRLHTRRPENLKSCRVFKLKENTVLNGGMGRYC
jgi:hypothetical protein